MSKIIACIDGSLVTNTVRVIMQLGLAINLIHLLNCHVIDEAKSKSTTDLSGAIGLGSRETLLKGIG